MNVYSNAFNFSAHLNGQVDPRTGQYGCQVRLTTLYPKGPVEASRDINLSFSMYNPRNDGYGIGWRLSNTEFDLNTRRLTLLTGEQFQTHGMPSVGGVMALKDRKLKDLVVKRPDVDSLHVIYKDGTVEVLRRQNSLRPYIISTVQFESGERVHFRYDPQGALERIVNQQGEDLLVLHYSGRRLAGVEARIEGGRFARTWFEQFNEQLVRVDVAHAPMGPGVPGSYVFEYEALRSGLVAIRRVKSPMGGDERIDYEENGHQYRDNTFLPRVKSWTRFPGAGQPSLKRTYRYSASQNFTGYPFSGGFVDGEDNLYLVLGLYDYWTEVRSQEGDDANKVLQVVRTEYNKFHLLTREVTDCAGTLTEREIEYNAVPGRLFAEQPANLQLPRRTTRHFRLFADQAGRKEVTEITTDDYGNELTRVEPSGLRREYDFYPVAGAMDQGVQRCPAEPHGAFVRFLKQSRELPATPTGGPTTAAKTTDYTYYALAASNGLAFVLPASITTRTGVQTRLTHYNAPGQWGEHGRLQASVTTQDKVSVAMQCTYSLEGDSLVQNKLIRRVGGDENQWLKSSQTLSLSTRRMLALTGEDGATLAFSYDALGRLVSEVSAPGTAAAAQRSYVYANASNLLLARMTATDAKGVSVVTRYDGDGREVSCARLIGTGDEQKEQVLKRLDYNALGQKIRQTLIDYLDENNVRTLVTEFAYNGWGQLSRTTAPDATVHIDESDPRLNLRTQGVVGLDLTQTHFNDFGQPLRVEHLSSSGERVTKVTHEYDGFGRRMRTVDQNGKRTEFTYDLFDRVVLIAETPPGGQAQRKTVLGYAPGSSEVRVASITVDGVALATRAFDDLGRLQSQQRGSGKPTHWQYGPGSLLPSSSTSPRGHVDRHTYDPHLGLVVRSTLEKHPDRTFEYDPISALLLSSKEADRAHKLDYDIHGRLVADAQVSDGVTRAFGYRYGSSGRLVQQQSDFGEAVEFDYDHAGRLLSMTAGSLVVTQGYDHFGRVIHVETRQGSERLVMALKHDPFGREQEREFIRNGGLLQTISSTYLPNGLLASRTLRDPARQVVIEETFTYDGYQRLSAYQCQGPQFPKDALGRPVASQSFTYDGLDNITQVVTRLRDGSEDTCTRYFEGTDPGQLTRLTHSHPPRDERLSYDESGNLVRGTAGRIYEFNGLEQLIGVHSAGANLAYRYDADARQVSQSIDGEPPVHLGYGGGRLEGLAQGALKVSFRRNEEQVLARTGGESAAQLQVLDAAGSIRGVLRAGQAQEHRHYLPYGYGTAATEGAQIQALVDRQYPAFNGERLDGATGLYHLGGGRRSYDPELMIFLSPDPMSPFGEGGRNSYAYCYCNPVNLNDPSGWVPTWLKWVLGVASLVLSVVTLGAAVAPLLGAAAVTLTGMTALGLVGGSLGLVGGTLGIAGLGVEAVDLAMGWDRSQHVNNLGWASFGFGLAATALGAAGAVLAGRSAAQAAASNAVAGAAPGRLSPGSVGLLAGVQKYSGWSLSLGQEAPTWVNRGVGVTKFALSTVGTVRSTLSRIDSLNGDPTGSNAMDEAPQQPSLQGDSNENRHADTLGNSQRFFEAFREQAQRIRQSSLGDIYAG